MRKSLRFARVVTLAALLSAAAGRAEPGLDSPLIDAVRADDRAAVQRLVGEGVDLNARDLNGSTALAWAALRSSAEIVALLTEAGADPNLASELGVSPLSLAIQNGAPDIVRTLLEHGADPNLAQETGETPLMTAARLGRVDIMKMLLERGADVNRSDKRFAQTALMWAAGNPEAVKLLLAHGADHRLVTKSWDVKYTIYAPETFTLGMTGIPWNTAGEYVSKKGGQNALVFAVQNRDVASAKALLDAGADVNAKAADGATPLLAALYKWAPLEQTDILGRGPLAAARNSQLFAPDLDMARLLLDRGASAIAADGAGYTPLHGAALAVVWVKSADDGRRRRGWQAPALISFNRRNAKPPSYTEEEALEVVRRLLEGGADPNQQTLYPTPGPAGEVRINPASPGSSALHVAANSASPALVALLARYGANPNLLRKDGHTPFSTAVVAGSVPVIEEMVAAGADLSMIYNPDDKIPEPVEALTLPRRGQTIMHIAAAATHGAEVLRALHAAGAVIDAKNEQGETPLDLADHQERFQEALARQNAAGNPELLKKVQRPKRTTAAIRELLGERATVAASSAR